MGDATTTRLARAGLRDAIMYAVATLVPLVVIVLLIRPWESGLAIPFLSGGDAGATGAVVKGVLHNGWWLTNPALGAPGISNAYELPGADTLFYVLIRLIGLGSGSWATVINVFYLLGYPVVGLTAVFALRKLGASRPVAACGAVIYALMPYHWMRGEGHLFLSFYAMVPLLVLVAFWMDGHGVPLLAPHEEGAPRKWNLRSRRSLAALVICAVGAATGIYYAFFGAALIVFAGVRAAIRTRERRIALAGLALALVMGAVAIAQAAPNLVLAAPLGKNPAGLVRNPGQAEIDGLKITQMFLPIDGHRIAAFARLKATYRAGLRQIALTLDNEADTAALGILMAIGFLVSLLAFVFVPARGSPDRDLEGVELVRSAGFLNLCALLLATVGGFGAMIAVILPEIRDYNRISTFIGFIAVVALAVLADRFLAKRTGRLARWGWMAALVAVTVIAVLDQTPASLAVPQPELVTYRSDVAFGRTLTATLPAGTVVFQLPYMPYPEPGGPFFGMQDYDPMRGYLQVDGFRWSYGAMKGRADDAWQKATAALPPAEMVAAARARGFTALWVQLNGYADGGVAIRASLAGLLGQPTAVSSDGVFVVWKL